MRKGPILKLLNLAVTIALIYFAYKYFVGLVADIDLSTININPFLVVLSVLLFLGFYLLLSLHWIRSVLYITGMNHKNIELAFFASQPYKYLPSSLFTFSFRAVFAKKLGISLKSSSFAQLIENASMLLSNFLLFILLIISRENLWFGILFAVIVNGSLVLFSRLGNRQINLRGRRFIIKPREIIPLLALAFVAWIVAGLSFIVLNHSIGLEVDWLSLLAANTIAFSAGILVFFAPGGIGVRELIYGVFSVSSPVIILWRILTFVVDIIVGLVSILIINNIKPSETRLN